MQMVRKQQPTAAAASTGARRGVTADAAAKSGCRMISAPRSAKEGTVVATSASASASGQTQGRTAAPAGLASRARGQTEGSVATANAVLCVVQNVVVLLLLLLMLLSGLQMCSSSSGRRGRRCVVVVVVVKVRMVSQLTLRSRRHRDILSTAIVHVIGAVLAADRGGDVVLSREPEAVVGAAHRRVEARRAPSPAGDGHAAAAAHVLTCARLGSGGGTGVVVFIL